jgi:hypothetical protein
MFVIANKYGRLGNRLQLFAHFIAFAVEHDHKVANPAFLEYAELFETTKYDLFCRYPPKKSVFRGYSLRWFLYAGVRLIVKAWSAGLVRLRRLKVIRAWPLNSPCIKREFRLDAPDFSDLVGSAWLILAEGLYFVDYPSLLKHADKIREYFRPAANYEANVNKVVALARKASDILVGVHMRFGDYRNWEGGEFFIGIDGYLQVMKKIEALHPGKAVGFLVCSDEVHDPTVFSGLNVVLGPNHIVEDLYTLAGCDYIIGGNSTYCRWASFYGDVPLCNLSHSKTMNVSLSDFQLFEEIVMEHMENADIFPRI